MLFCFQSKAQTIDFVFTKEFNESIVLKEGKSPYVFEILSEEQTTTITKPASTRLSQFYKRTLAFQKKAKSDSAKIAELKKASKYTPEIAKKLNETDVNNRLSIAKRSLKNAKKYDTVPSTIILEKHDVLKIRRSVFKPQNVIIGDFKRLGAYYVTKNIDGYNERSLIPVADAKKRNLTKEHFLFGDKFELIQNIQTEVIYMVYPDFLEKYPVR